MSAECHVYGLTDVMNGGGGGGRSHSSMCVFACGDVVDDGNGKFDVDTRRNARVCAAMRHNIRRMRVAFQRQMRPFNRTGIRSIKACRIGISVRVSATLVEPDWTGNPLNRSLLLGMCLLAYGCHNLYTIQPPVAIHHSDTSLITLTPRTDGTHPQTNKQTNIAHTQFAKKLIRRMHRIKYDEIRIVRPIPHNEQCPRKEFEKTQRTSPNSQAPNRKCTKPQTTHAHTAEHAHTFRPKTLTSHAPTMHARPLVCGPLCTRTRASCSPKNR